MVHIPAHRQNLIMDRHNVLVSLWTGTTNILIYQMLTKKARGFVLGPSCRSAHGDHHGDHGQALLIHGQALLIHSLISCLQDKPIVQIMGR